MKPIPLTEFYRQLHARGLTISTLALRLNCGRSHLSQVFNGRRSGRPTWRKLIAAGLLTTEEQALLVQAGVENVPRGANSHVEQQMQEAAS